MPLPPERLSGNSTACRLAVATERLGGAARRAGRCTKGSVMVPWGSSAARIAGVVDLGDFPRCSNS